MKKFSIVKNCKNAKKQKNIHFKDKFVLSFCYNALHVYVDTMMPSLLKRDKSF